MDDQFWLDFDLDVGRAVALRLIRTCPACRTVWDLSIPSRRLWNEAIRCPRCGVRSVRDRRLRALWFRHPLRRVVEAEEGERHG